MKPRLVWRGFHDGTGRLIDTTWRLDRWTALGRRHWAFGPLVLSWRAR